MMNLPKNPKPHINETKVSLKKRIKHDFDYDKVLKEMIAIIRENKKLEKEYLSSKNETVYR